MPADRLSDEQSRCRASLVQREDGRWHCPTCGFVSPVVTPRKTGPVSELRKCKIELAATRKALADKLAAVRGLAEEWESQAAAEGEMSFEAVEFLTEHAARLREIVGGE